MAFHSILHYNDGMDAVKRPYRSKLRTEQTEATRRRILDAAQHLFARQGYQGTTMEQLAEEAGVAMQTLYAAFGSKVNLALAVINQVVLASLGLPEMAQQAGAMADAEQALREAAQVNRVVSERLVDLEALISGANLREIALEGTRRREESIAGVLATVLASARRRPELSDAEVRDTILALTSVAVYRTLVKERGWSPERYAQWLGDLLVAAVLR